MYRPVVCRTANQRVYNVLNLVVSRDVNETFRYETETRLRRDGDVGVLVRDETEAKILPYFPETETIDFGSQTRPRPRHCLTDTEKHFKTLW